MKTRIFAILFAILWVMPIFAQNFDKSVTLTTYGETSKTIDVGFANITVSATSRVGSRAEEVTFSVENLDDRSALLLFKYRHNESDLRRMRPKHEYDKTFGGSKGFRDIDACRLLSKDVCIYPAESVRNLVTVAVNSDNKVELTLPFYVARIEYKGKKGQVKKLRIIDKSEVKLTVTVESYNKDEFDKVASRVSELQGDFAKVECFCTNSKHSPSLDEQMKPYKTRKDELLAFIDSVIAANKNWTLADEPYVKYSELRKHVEEIDLDGKKGDCGKHKITPNNGGRRKGDSITPSVSAQEAFNAVNQIYQMLYSGKIDKATAIKQANAAINGYKAGSNKTLDDKIARFVNNIRNY